MRMQPASHIKKLLRSGWTETGIASATGVHQSTINRIKLGQRPNFETGCAILNLRPKKKAALRKRVA